MAISAEHMLKVVTLHRQWWRIQMSEKFSSGTKKSKQTNKTQSLRLYSPTQYQNEAISNLHFQWFSLCAQDLHILRIKLQIHDYFEKWQLDKRKKVCVLQKVLYAFHLLQLVHWYGSTRIVKSISYTVLFTGMVILNKQRTSPYLTHPILYMVFFWGE